MLGLHDRSWRDRNHEISGAGAAAVAALTRLAGTGTPVRVVMEIQEAVHTGIHQQDDVTTPAAVAPVGATERFELLPVDRGAAVSTVTGFGMDQDAVDETCHRATAVRRGC